MKFVSHHISHRKYIVKYNIMNANRKSFVCVSYCQRASQVYFYVGECNLRCNLESNISNCGNSTIKWFRETHPENFRAIFPLFRKYLNLCQMKAHIIAELQRPEGQPSGAPYSYREEKETRELIFLWSSWPGALLVGAYARRRSRATWRPYSK